MKRPFGRPLVVLFLIAIFWPVTNDRLHSSQLFPAGFEVGKRPTLNASDSAWLSHDCHFSVWPLSTETKVQIDANHVDFLAGLEDGFLGQYSHRHRPQSADWKLLENTRIVAYILLRDMRCNVGSFSFPLNRLTQISSAETTIIALDDFERGEGLAFLILPKESFVVRLSVWSH